MKMLALLLAVLLLSGCGHLPYPREMGDMALLRTVGVDGGGDRVILTVSTGPRAKGVQGEGQPALVLKGEGATLSATALALQGQSDHYVYFGYVDQLLLGEGAARAGILPVLDWFARDLELSLGAQLWLVRGEASAGVEAGGDQGIDSRLSTLRTDGEMGLAAIPRRAGEVYTDLLELGSAYLPALVPGEEGEAALTGAGYAILKEGALAGFLEGEGARGLELLAGRPSAHVLTVELPRGRVTAQVTEAALAVRLGEEGLDLTCRVAVRPLEYPGPLTGEERSALREEAVRQSRAQIAAALTQLRAWQADPLGLGARGGLTDPARWGQIRDRWPQVFARQAPEITVHAEIKP